MRSHTPSTEQKKKNNYLKWLWDKCARKARQINANQEPWKSGTKYIKTSEYIMRWRNYLESEYKESKPALLEHEKADMTPEEVERYRWTNIEAMRIHELLGICLEQGAENEWQ